MVVDVPSYDCTFELVAVCKFCRNEPPDKKREKLEKRRSGQRSKAPEFSLGSWGDEPPLIPAMV
jgi:hypothetical protein